MNNNTVTYSKAIGIILMVLGHCECGIPFVRQNIYMFHMPLFFFFSGFCLKKTYFNLPFEFFARRVKGLWWPYVKWSILFLISHNFFYNKLAEFNHNYINSIYTVQEIAIRGFRILFSMSGHEPIINTFWFMRALFFGSIGIFLILYINNKLAYDNSKSYRHRLFFILISLIILLVVIGTTCKRYSFCQPLTQILLGGVFYLCGHLFNEYKIPSMKSGQIILTFIITFIGSFIWKQEMVNSPYNNTKIIPYIITGVLGTWAIYSLSYERLFGIIKTYLLFCGQHTMIILALHFVVFKFVSYFIIKLYHLSFLRIDEIPVIYEYAPKGWWLLYWIMGVSIPLILINYIINLKKKIKG